MAGTTYSFFFWQDYSGDAELRLCSLQAQAVWMRLLCIAANAEPAGHVLVNGKAPSADELRRLFGCTEPPEVISACIEELKQKGVCDVTREGTLVSRRMMRDARKQRRNSEAGKRSARAKKVNDLLTSPSNEKPISTGSNGVHQRRVQYPESSIQNPVPVTGPTAPDSRHSSLDKALSKAERLCRAIGVTLTDDITRMNWPKLINQMIDDGVDFDAMEEAARVMKRDGLLPEDGVRTPMFFKQAALKIMRRGKPLEVVPATDPKLTREDWMKHLNMFARWGMWPTSKAGPSPLQQGCLAPIDLLVIVERAWREQGNGPFMILVGNQDRRWNEATEAERERYSAIKHPTPVILPEAPSAKTA